MNASDEVDIDKIINKLLENGGKEVKLLESEIRGLCLKSREIFLEQPMLLELEAPIKICGNSIITQEIFMVNIRILLSFSSTLVFQVKQTTSFWATM
jgi:hypothetical protein